MNLGNLNVMLLSILSVNERLRARLHPSVIVDSDAIAYKKVTVLMTLSRVVHNRDVQRNFPKLHGLRTHLPT